MRAVQILGDSASPRITINNNILQPSPLNSEILIQTYAAGVTGDELSWPELYLAENQRIPGHEVSGKIAALGPQYHGDLKVGNDVWTFSMATRGGAQAEYVICSGDEVALKPRSISHAECAALPIPILTAWEAIMDHVKMVPGVTVLVTGASGAVGQMFVQLATLLGNANVIALASPQHHETLRKLGANQSLNYKIQGWEDSLVNVDVVLDAVGGDILTKTWKTISANGSIITIADPPPPWAFGRCPAAESKDYPEVMYKYFVVLPNPDRLTQAAALIDEGRLKVLPVMTFQPHEAEEAWSYTQQRSRAGKAVIQFAEQKSMSVP